MKRVITLTGFIIILAAAMIWWTNKGNERQADNPVDASGSKAIVSINLPEIAGVALEGQKLFSENCAACHGENAVGVEGSGPPLVHIIYEPNHHADISFQLAVKRGVRAHHWKFGDMAPVEGVPPQDVDKIIAFVRALQRANGIN